MNNRFWDANDEEVIELVTKLQSIDSFKDKMMFIYNNTGIEDLSGDSGIQKTINGITYEWGIQPKTKEEWNTLGFLHILHYRPLYFETLWNSFERRSKKCERSDEIFELIRGECEEISQTLNNGDPFLKVGYSAERRKDKVLFDEKARSNDFKKVAIGAAYYLYEQKLKELLKIESQKDKSHATEDELIDLNLPNLSNR